MADPEHVDAIDCRDLVDMRQTALRLDLRNDRDFGIRRRDLVRRITRRIIIMGKPEGSAAPTGRRVARRLDNNACFPGIFDHRDHQALHADIKRPGEELIFAPRNTTHRDNRQPPAKRDLVFQGLQTDPGMLHVVEHVLAPGMRQDLGDTRAEKLENHGAEHRFTRHGSLPECHRFAPFGTAFGLAFPAGTVRCS